METSRGGGDPYTHGPDGRPVYWETQMVRDAAETFWKLV